MILSSIIVILMRGVRIQPVDFHHGHDTHRFLCLTHKAFLVQICNFVNGIDLGLDV